MGLAFEELGERGHPIVDEEPGVFEDFDGGADVAAVVVAAHREDVRGAKAQIRAGEHELQDFQGAPDLVGLSLAPGVLAGSGVEEVVGAAGDVAQPDLVGALTEAFGVGVDMKQDRLVAGGSRRRRVDDLERFADAHRHRQVEFCGLTGVVHRGEEELLAVRAGRVEVERFTRRLVVAGGFQAEAAVALLTDGDLAVAGDALALRVVREPPAALPAPPVALPVDAPSEAIAAGAGLPYG